MLFKHPLIPIDRRENNSVLAPMYYLLCPKVLREDLTLISYDIIGDVHGCADMLHGLLDQLGWEHQPDGTHSHPDPDRKAIFVGDLVDRGPKQLETLQTVRAMVDAGSAQVVMGNHEFNAVSYATLHPASTGEYLREHSERNTSQHRAFLEQLSDAEKDYWIDWFRTLPLWLELDGLRVVHACWHQDSIDLLTREFGGATFPEGDEAFLKANTKQDPIWEAIEVILKGPEIELAPHRLPNYLDKEEHVRKLARARWWVPSPSSIRDLIDLPEDTLDESKRPYPPIPESPCTQHDLRCTYSDSIPVFYGHHWRKWEPSQIDDWTLTTACVDFSAVKGGPMAAYQWSGETEIDPTHYRHYPPDSAN